MNAPTAACNSCGSWWRLPLLLAIVLLAVWLLRDRGVREATPAKVAERTKPAAAAKPAEATGQTVSLTIDYGDGRRTEFAPIAWREGMTVYDLTSETSRSDLRLKVRGTGQSAFLAALDDIENEGADGRNWTYYVDGKMGDRSFAVYELAPGSQVLWTFSKQQ
jgi:hypothetical protein